MLDQVEWHKTAQVVVSVICPLVTSGDIWQLYTEIGWNLCAVCQNCYCAHCAHYDPPVGWTAWQQDQWYNQPGAISSSGANGTNGTSSLLLTLSYLGCAMATCKMFTPLGIAWGPWGIPLCFFDDLYHSGGPYGPNARSSTCLLQYSPNRSAQKEPETQTRTHEKFKLNLGTTWVDGDGMEWHQCLCILMIDNRHASSHQVAPE